MIHRDHLPIYEDAIEHWGKGAQCLMVTEELAEVLVAMSHYLRGRDTTGIQVAREIADALIMLEQLTVIIDLEAEVDFFKEQKLDRLKGMLEKVVVHGCG